MFQCQDRREKLTALGHFVVLHCECFEVHNVVSENTKNNNASFCILQLKTSSTCHEGIIYKQCKDFHLLALLADLRHSMWQLTFHPDRLCKPRCLVPQCFPVFPTPPRGCGNSPTKVDVGCVQRFRCEELRGLGFN